MNDWIVCTNTTHGAMMFQCERCGSAYKPALPAYVPMLLAMMESFVESHQDCKETKPE